MWCWDCLKQLILSCNIGRGIAKPSLAMLSVSALLNSGIEKKKICRSEAYGKRTRRMRVTRLQKKLCLPQQGKMCWITLEIHAELLLLHSSIISWVLFEFLILNFVPIRGRRLDSTSLYADGLIENCLPLPCFSMIKLERKVVWGILEQAMCTRHPNSLNPANRVVILGPAWRCRTASPMGISSLAGNWKENLHQCVYPIFHLFHCRMLCRSK